MKNIIEITQQEAKDHENKTDANVRLGGYDMDKAFPIGEVKCFRVSLEEIDVVKIYLLKEHTFHNFTKGQTYKLTDVTTEIRSQDRVKDIMGEKGRSAIDLISNSNFSPILVGNSLEGPFTIIDGNHRLSAHFMATHSLNGIQAIIYIHDHMKKWTYFSYPY